MPAQEDIFPPAAGSQGNLLIGAGDSSITETHTKMVIHVYLYDSTIQGNRDDAESLQP